MVVMQYIQKNGLDSLEKKRCAECMSNQSLIDPMAINFTFYAIFLFLCIKFVSHGNIGIVENISIVLIASFLYQFLTSYSNDALRVGTQPQPFRWMPTSMPFHKPLTVAPQEHKQEPFNIDLKKNTRFTEAGAIDLGGETAFAPATR
jgi:hypothetical protein